MSDISQSQLAAISRLFSPSVVRELARRGFSPTFSKLAQESSLLDELSPSENVSSLYDRAFSVLKTGRNRDEYIYKAALTEKVLLGTHSLNTASMLTEFRTGDCKADLVILNGTATVYEIKSERDSLSRLERQIAEYKKVFAKVYVIAGENHVDSVMDLLPKDVGVMELSKRYRISTLRNAKDRTTKTSPISIFESIRMREAEMILDGMGLSVPDVPNTEKYAAFREIFDGLKPRKVHEEMVRVLKRSRNLLPLGSLIDELPKSLHSVALSTAIKKSDHQRLVEAVNTPIRKAMAWA